MLSMYLPSEAAYKTSYRIVVTYGRLMGEDSFSVNADQAEQTFYSELVRIQTIYDIEKAEGAIKGAWNIRLEDLNGNVALEESVA